MIGLKLVMPVRDGVTCIFMAKKRETSFDIPLVSTEHRGNCAQLHSALFKTEFHHPFQMFLQALPLAYQQFRLYWIAFPFFRQ